MLSWAGNSKLRLCHMQIILLMPATVNKGKTPLTMAIDMGFHGYFTIMRSSICLIPIF